ncbi:Histone H2B type 1-B [Cichlidogyrus casuarinus]|uniref:Histone H2B type 1-B n=1 Tax=Cichlidogyrus casuarinus TaxID=1844966 RepID=A0ABD2PRI6_9PLAT
MSATPAVKKAKSSKPAANHPPTIDMVNAAIKSTADRKGASLATIKKYIAANYKFDVERNSLYIRKALVHALEKGQIVRVGNKGKGASGSFKLADKAAKVKKSVKKMKTPKKEKPAKSTTDSAKKPKASKPKKATTKKTPVKKAASKKPMSPKTKKTPSKKPKAKKTPKKAAAPKK